MMKTSTPTTKNNSKKDDSSSRSSKSNSTNKTPTRKPSIKLRGVHLKLMSSRLYKYQLLLTRMIRMTC